MEYIKAGVTCKMGDVPTGGCIMFVAHNETKVGIVVEFSEEERGIIDPNYVGEDNREYPVIYSASSFRTDTIFWLERARIVPDLSLRSAKFGTHGSGRVSKALYIAGDELVLQAARNRDVCRFDLVTGKVPAIYDLSRLYVTRWCIQTPDADGDYQLLAEFSA